MNKNQFRIVFNASRGMRMAVAETATSQGKGSPGESRGSNGSRAASALFALTAGASLVLLSGLLAEPLSAQVIADRSAPGNQQASFSQSGNDRMASLYLKSPRTQLASAGNNIHLTAA
jgi:filamentous hemagglutinin